MTCIRIIKHIVHCQDCGKTWVDEDEECTCTCSGPGLPEPWTVTVMRPWPYDGPEGRARLTGSLDTGGSFTGDDDDDSEFRQSATACCPRQTIPDSCSCPEGCECMCTDCICGNWGEEYDDG